MKKQNNKKQNKVIGKFSFATDVGKVRITNEDQALAMTNAKGEILLLVCDGMGGQNHGELASKIARDTFHEEFMKNPVFMSPFMEHNWIRKVAKKANTLIYEEAQDNPLYKGMGTTLTVAIVGKSHITIGQIGDSRAYMLERHLVQLTDDQTYVGYLYRSGQISEQEMLVHPKRHVLLNALGIYPGLNIDIQIKKYHGQTLLLCSDGLYNNINTKDVESILKLDDSPQQKCDELIKLANDNGGSDNIAVVYWEANKHGN